MNHDKLVDILLIFGGVVWFIPLLGNIGFILTSTPPPIRAACAILSTVLTVWTGVRAQKWFSAQPFIKTRFTKKDYRTFANLKLISLPTAEEEAERHWKKKVW